MRKIVAVAALALSLASVRSYAQFPAAPGTGPGLAETIEAIDSARVTTRILYVTAHPDDESGAVLTYLARGLHADVALLSLTRGEGGQNALGPEQAPQLGLIRTQELLAATRGYGVKLYFTRAKDFGFSKTPEETEKAWGDEAVDDMVYLIRDFRPNIVINGWGGVHGGHGHHQASGLLTPKAIQLAADESYKKTMCDDCGAWKVSQVLDLDRGSDHPRGHVLPLDEISALYGRSWRRIGIDAFANHRTQGITGFIGSPFLLRPIGLIREDGQPLDPTSLAVRLTAEFKGCVGVEAADRELESARVAVLQLAWKEAGEEISLAASNSDEAIKTCRTFGDGQKHNAIEGIDRWLDLVLVKLRIGKAAQLIAGVDVSALADRNDLTAGEVFHITERARCRAEAGCAMGKSKLVSIAGFTQVKEEGDLESGKKFTVQVDDNARAAEGVIGSSGEKTLHDAASPYPFSYSQILFGFRMAGYDYSDYESVKFLAANSTTVNLVPLRIVPAYTLAVEPKQEIEKLAAKHEPFDVFLRVHSYSQKAATVSVGLDVPAGWKSSGAMDVSFTGEGDRYAKLTVTPPAKMDAGHYTITAYAKRGEGKFTTSIEPLVSMPTLTWEEPAQTVVHAFDIKVPENLRVGYISAESEPVPDALKMLGIHVEQLDAAALNFGDCMSYALASVSGLPLLYAGNDFSQTDIQSA